MMRVGRSEQMVVLRRSVALAATVLTAGMLLAGCGIPSDPDGTLASVRGNELSVGVTQSRDRVLLTDTADPAGPEVDLVRGFADSLDADVVFVEGSEAELIDSLDRGVIDVAIGGFLDDTPWADRVGVTMPYAETTDETGTREPHVMLTPLGENALLLALDQYLSERDPR